MGLISRLFRDDAKLQACLVSDPAHLVVGVRGDHVGKVQYALLKIDGLVIDRSELVSRTYGASTAKAVLDYKTKRQIINRSYQSKADNIVGKMTIKSLDDEMLRRESSRPALDDCTLSTGGSASVARALSAAPVAAIAPGAAGLNIADGRSSAPPQVNRILHIHLSITSKAVLEFGFPIRNYLQITKDILFEHGIRLSVEFSNEFADTIPFPDNVILDDDVVMLRKASEDIRPGHSNVLRIIVCPMDLIRYGATFRNKSIGTLNFPPFVLLNARLLDRSEATLIHEMIHAAYPGPRDHDNNQPHSVFFPFGTTELGKTARTFLRPEHAAQMGKSFFAF